MFYPPYRNPLNINQPTYTEVDWTSEQVNLTLRLVIDKLSAGDPTYSIIEEDFRRSSFNIKSNNVFISLDKDLCRVFIILDNKAAGSFYPRFWFWRDTKVKASMTTLRNMIVNAETIAKELKLRAEEKHKTEVAMEALFNAFPEVIAQEFEKHVLANTENKDGEEETTPAGTDSTGS